VSRDSSRGQERDRAFKSPGDRSGQFRVRPRGYEVRANTKPYGPGVHLDNSGYRLNDRYEPNSEVFNALNNVLDRPYGGYPRARDQRSEIDAYADAPRLEVSYQQKPQSMSYSNPQRDYRQEQPIQRENFVQQPQTCDRCPPNPQPHSRNEMKERSPYPPDYQDSYYEDYLSDNYSQDDYLSDQYSDSYDCDYPEEYPETPLNFQYHHKNITEPVYNPPIDSKERLNHRKIGHEDETKIIKGWPHKKMEFLKTGTDHFGNPTNNVYLSWVPINHIGGNTVNDDIRLAESKGRAVHRPNGHQQQSPYEFAGDVNGGGPNQSYENQKRSVRFGDVGGGYGSGARGKGQGQGRMESPRQRSPYSSRNNSRSFIENNVEPIRDFEAGWNGPENSGHGHRGDMHKYGKFRNRVIE
jgi:hypothetical protein